MIGNGTETSSLSLPMVLEAQRPRPTLLRLAPRAAFLSHLIAERQHLPSQRQRRRLPPLQAVDAYAAGASVTVVRMPVGYRRSVVA